MTGVSFAVAVLRTRWSNRLVHSLLALVMAGVLALGVDQASVPGILLGGAGVAVTLTLAVGAWRGRFVVEPDMIRLRTLRGWQTLRFDELDSISYSRNRYGAVLVLVGGSGFRAIGVGGSQYSVRKLGRALAPGINARRDHIDVRDEVGTLDETLDSAAAHPPT